MTIMTVGVPDVIEYDAFPLRSVLLVTRKNYPPPLSKYSFTNIHARLFCFAILFGIFIAARTVTRIRALVRVDVPLSLMVK